MPLNAEGAAVVAAHSCRTGLLRPAAACPYFFHHNTHRRPWTASCGCCFFLIHDASPAQVRGKTESPRRHLSFLPNSKTSRALNHRQYDMQGAPVRQPCPLAVEVSREIILVGPQLLIFWSKNKELLEMDSFLSLHTYLGSW